MNNKDMDKKAAEYFSTMNSIASRLYIDISETKAAYEELWNTLTPNEQEQILNESIIKPEVQIKYNGQENHAHTVNQEYSSKIIIDENNCSYRDEHSAPFSFKTQSQRDLSILSSNESKPKKPARLISIPKASVIKEKVLIEPKTDMEESEEEISKDLVPKTGLDFLDNW